MDTAQTKDMPILLQKLIKRQKRSNLSDYKFAARLGVDRIVWYTTRKGRRNIGISLLKAIAKNLPELNQDILNFLKDSGGGD